MNITDISIDKDKVVIGDALENVLQEIGILFDTSKGEVLGADSFGTSFENLLWDLNTSNSQISEYIRSAIVNQTAARERFDISVSTRLMYGTMKDIIIATITVTDRETGAERTVNYKI